MEINFSKSRLIQIAALMLVIAAAVVAYQIIPTLFAHESSVDVNAYNNQPAMQALSTIYTPAGEQADWERSVCANMTSKGCEIFKAYYAAPIWQSDLKGTSITFVAVRDTLEDGTQIWQAEAAANGIAQPVFIHVEKQADEQWFLARILFEEEAKKYEK